MARGVAGQWRVVAGLAVFWAMTSLGAPSALAVDSDLKHAYAFRVEASNGYSIVALAANERADGRGEIVLFVGRRGEGATYVAPAVLTATSLNADLGPLGRVSLAVASAGEERTFRSRCGGEPETNTYEPQRYTGSFEFHGEEGYTDVVTDAPRESTRVFFRLFCPGNPTGETTGAELPGARLRLRARRGDFRLDLQANKNRPRERSRFEVDVREKRGEVSISRHTSLWVGPGAFRYDPLLGTATLDPPAPFSGRASFHRHAQPRNRWTGNLTVDLPGRSDVPLTGSAVSATLVPSCQYHNEGRIRC